MNETMQAELLLGSLGLLGLSGLGTLLLGGGRRAPAKEGAWLVWSGFALYAIDLIFNIRELLRDGATSVAWTHSWMLPTDQIGAVTAGILIDPLALIFGVFIFLLSVLFLINVRPGAIIHGALAIGASGAALAWVATTPWLAFLGIALASLGGFIALCADRASDAGAGLASQYAWQRFAGLSLAVLGACALAGGRNALMVGGLTAENAIIWNLATHADVLGACLLTIGLLLQFEAFPLLGWSVTGLQLRLAERALLTLILPGLAALSFLLKLEPQLRGSDWLAWLPWAAVASAVLTLLTGFFNSRREAALLAWISSGFMLAFAAAFRAGSASGIALAAGAALPAFALGLLLEAPSPHFIERIAAYIAAAAGVGAIGFISAGGWFDWLARDNFIAAVFFLHCLLAWSLAWQGVVKAGAAAAPGARSPWVAGLSSILVSLLLLGLLWNGSLSGGLIRSDGDQVLPGLAKLPFSLPAGADLSTVRLIFGVTLLLALILSIWLPFEKLRESLPGGKFIAQGYWLHQLAARLRAGLAAVGRLASAISEDRIWQAYLPRGLLWVLRGLAVGLDRLTDGAYRWVTIALSRGVSGPARVLQLVQSGDVQWYLFFAAGSGFLLLIHFLRT